MDNGGGALQGTGVCVARAPFGARLPPLPAENLEISPPRLLHCSRGSHSLRNRARHLCARGAGLTRRRSPTIGLPIDIWLCTESGLGLSRPEIRSSTKDVGHLRFPAGLVQTQAA